MDDQLYLDFNRLSRDSSFLHGLISAFARFGCFGLLACCLVYIAVASGGPAISRNERAGRSEAAAALVAGGLAYLAGLLLSTAIGRSAPAISERGVTVLFSEGSHTFPDPLSAAAAAVTVVLLCSRLWRLGVAAVVLGVLEALSVVYAGAARPSDALGGLGLGLLVALAVVGVLSLARSGRSRSVPSGANQLVVGIQPGHGAILGPASQQASAEASGAVRILSSDPIRPVKAGGLNPTAGGARSS